MATQAPTLFDQMLEEELRDPAFRAAFEQDMQVVATIQTLLKTVDKRRQQSGLSKAELARRTGLSPASLRRLFTSGQGNPTLESVLRILGELGLELEVKPAANPGAIRDRRSHRADVTRA